MDENCPFVLELEIDDEISFKPMSRKPRALQDLDCNIVPTPDKSPQSGASTPCTTPRKTLMNRFTSPKTIKERKHMQSATKGSIPSDYLATTLEPAPRYHHLPTSAVKSSQKIKSIIGGLTPSRLTSTPKRKEGQPLKKSSPPLDSVDKRLFEVEEADSDPVGMVNEMSTERICNDTNSEETVAVFTGLIVAEVQSAGRDSPIGESLVESPSRAAAEAVIQIMEESPAPSQTYIGITDDSGSTLQAEKTWVSDLEPAEAQSKQDETTPTDTSAVEPQAALVTPGQDMKEHAPVIPGLNTGGPMLTKQQVTVGLMTGNGVNEIVNDISDMLLSVSIDEKASESRGTRNPRRVSTALALHDEYLEALHMPQYSQAEMDTARAAWVKEQNQEVARRVSAAVQEVRVSLDEKSDQLCAARDTIAALQKEISRLQQDRSVSEHDKSEIISLEMSLKELTSQNKTLEEQLASQHAAHIKEMDKLRADHEQYVLNVMANDAQTLSAATSAVTEKYEKLLSDEREVSCRHLHVLAEAKDRVTALETELPLAVQEAKRKVYEKAQAQFAAGNKEFQKVKNTLRDALCAKEEGDQKIASLELSLQNMSTQLSAAEEMKDKINSDILAMSSRLELMVKSDAGILSDKCLSPLEAVGSVLTYYRDKNGESTQLLSKAHDEKTKHEASVQELKGLLSSAQITVKELQEALCRAEERAGTVTEALNSAKRENQNQLVLTANVMSEKGRIESALTSSKNELECSLLKQTELSSQLLEAQAKVEELTTRCDELRAMNKEVIEMLEAMYAKEGSGPS